MNPQDTSTQDWFNSIQPPGGAPSSSPKPSGGKGKLVLLVAVGLLFVGGVVVALLVFAGREPEPAPAAAAKACLTKADYQAFIGAPLEDDLELDPTTNFYTDSVDFALGSAEYAAATSSESQAFLQKVGQLYKEHGDASSVAVTISGGYVEGVPLEVVHARIAKLKQALTDAGVASAAITTEEPQAISLEEDTPTADTPLIVSVTSAEGCTTAE